MARILVIDDEDAIARVISQALGIRGHEATVARDGKEGIGHFHERQPDLVITDILMPEVEGLEAIRTMRRVNPRIPIIAMSGSIANGGVSFLAIAEKFGADAVLPKPFRTSELLALVERLLADRQS
ncbi:response regulator transcription factor [Zavarzinia sp. CC-PAN008]|uniref:response regulator transcription factor n=1 Tax=Zavarzinia sp. CC-PAN008 TaxID=3243332 RepID=UPI003F744A79